MISSLLLLFAPLQEAPAQRPFDLMVGDPAPAIQVAEWVQGQAVTAFEPGQVYVVEFWATWCGPCRVAIPHLNDLSKQYGAKVRFIGVSVSEHLADEPYSVPQFVRGMGEKMTYTVAADLVKASEEKGPMDSKWMQAAGQGTIPTAFIVTGDGKIAWIGHPLAIEKPLAEVVGGHFDLASAAKKYALDMRSKGAVAKLTQEITRAKKEKDFARALQLVDTELARDPSLEAYFGLEKYFLLIDAQRGPDAATYGKHLVAEVIGDNPTTLNKLAWSIVDPQGKRKQGDYTLAVMAAERAVKLQEENDAATLDTLGLALFRAGQIDRAITTQEKAVALAKDTPLEKELRERLDEFKNARKSL